MCPTPIGRIHTRVATLVPAALLGVILSLIDGKPDWIVLIGIFLVMGVTLDSGVYSWALKYQPPWMTGVLGLAELGILFVLANVLELDLTAAQAIIFYVVSWFLAIATKIALLPIFSLTYLESSGEFRRVEWSVPPAQASVPVLASPQEAAAGPGPVLQAASGVHGPPLELKPGPSGVHERVRR